MKKLIIPGLFLFCLSPVFGQVKSIVKNDNNLIVNDSITLTVGSEIKLGKPSSQNQSFFFIKPKSDNLKKVSNSAKIISGGASVLGSVVGKPNLFDKMLKIQRGADAVDNGTKIYGAIYNKKNIKAQSGVIKDFYFIEEGYHLTIEIEGKEYDVMLADAVNAGEIIL